MSDEPTKRQLGYLKGLGYKGPPPQTVDEASYLIDRIKDGKRVGDRDLEKYRQADHREWVKETKAHHLEDARDSLRENKRFLREFGEAMWAGYLIKAGRRCTKAQEINGLLISVEDATKHREMLPPYDGCVEDTCECDLEPVRPIDVPRGTRMAEFTGSDKPAKQPPTRRATKKTPQAKGGQGCLVLLLIVGGLFVGLAIV